MVWYKKKVYFKHAVPTGVLEHRNPKVNGVRDAYAAPAAVDVTDLAPVVTETMGEVQ